MQTTAIRTVANSLPQNEVILLTLLISKRYIPNTDLRKFGGISDCFNSEQSKKASNINQNTGCALLHPCKHFLLEA